MAAKVKPARKCRYSKCYLPKDNNVYKCQFLFMVFGLACFFFMKNESSYFNILLFLLPILFDLCYNEVEGKVLTFIKRTFICIDVASVIMCFVGMTMFEENGLMSSANSLFWGKIYFTNVKTWLFFIALSNIIVPSTFLIGRPCEKTLQTVEVRLSND